MKKITISFLFAISFCCLAFQCGKESYCDYQTIIDLDQYYKTVESEMRIKDAWIEEDCLSIEFSSGGCNGRTWSGELVDSEKIDLSTPPKRYIKFFLDDKEDCEALIHKTYSFDLSDLQLNDANQIHLILSDFDKLLEYSY